MSESVTRAALDPQGYLHRIGFPAPLSHNAPSLPLLRALHEAHMLAVPFENLSIHYGQIIMLRDEALYDKIVTRRRGGFCYELNGLLAWLLRRLGYAVTLLSAEVAGSDGSFSAPFDHLTLLVHELDGADWLADVGFGDSFRCPLRFVPDIEQDGADGRFYRFCESATPGVEDGALPYWLVEQRSDAQALWEPAYRFTLRPHDLNDFTDRCQYQQTSPKSHFTQRRICSLAVPHGRVTLSDLRLITTLHGVREERLLASEDEYQAVLAERFGVVL
jgi:N-hydroxyarylamine O-acetyltransferase